MNEKEATEEPDEADLDAKATGAQHVRTPPRPPCQDPANLEPIPSQHARTQPSLPPSPLPPLARPLPKLPLGPDIQLDEADLELEPIPKLELAWGCGPEPEPAYASICTTPATLSRATSPSHSRPVSAAPLRAGALARAALAAFFFREVEVFDPSHSRPMSAAPPRAGALVRAALAVPLGGGGVWRVLKVWRRK